MEKIFLIAGLGADYRLFKYIDLPGYDMIHAHYFDPAKDDTLVTYATKLIERYGITDDANVLGVSLGGMLAIEISRQLNIKNAIIISSMKSRAEAPAYQSFFRTIPLYKLIPGKAIPLLGFLLKPFFVKRMGGESDVFEAMLKSASPLFLKWAMDAVLKWDPEPVSHPIHHIIGDADLVFNYKRAKGATIIKGGDHMMVFTKGKEISSLIKAVLAAQLHTPKLSSV